MVDISHIEIQNVINSLSETHHDIEPDIINYNSTNNVEPVDMYNVIQTLNDISQENDHQDICTVCQDILDNGEQVHFLPECKHGYHTNCILSWFRNGSNTCPCCGDRGVNHKETKTTGSRSRTTSTWGWACNYKIRQNPHYLKLRAFALRKDAPKQLKEIVDKLKNSEKELLDSIKNFKDGRTERDDMPYKEVHNIVHDFHKTRKRLQEKTNKYIGAIIEYPIIPLIIPVRKKMSN